MVLKNNAFLTLFATSRGQLILIFSTSFSALGRSSFPLFTIISAISDFVFPSIDSVEETGGSVFAWGTVFGNAAGTKSVFLEDDSEVFQTSRSFSESILSKNDF
jgi:hypothetical protein